MSFTHRNTQGATAAASTTLTITKPTSLAVGDLMVATIGKDDDVSISTGPTGWTNRAEASGTAGNDNNGSIWDKVADAADVAASNFTWTGDAEDYAGEIAAFIPGNSSPLFVQATAVRRENDATPASNALTTTAGNLLVAGGTGNRAATTAGVSIVTAGWTVPTNGKQQTGTANGDVATTIAYDLSAAGGSETVEFGNVNSAGESVVTFGEWSDVTAPTSDITFDADSSDIATSSASLTFEHTCTTESNRILIVAVETYLGGGGQIPTITYDGASMTQVPSATSLFGGADDERLSMFYRVAPSTGANNIVITCASTHGEIVAAAASFYGVDQTTPIGTYDSDVQDGSSSFSITVTDGASGDMVVDAMANWSNTSEPSVGSGQTIRSSYLGTTTNDSVYISSKVGAASVTNTYTWTQAEDGAMFGINLFAGGGATPAESVLPFFAQLVGGV